MLCFLGVTVNVDSTSILKLNTIILRPIQYTTLHPTASRGRRYANKKANFFTTGEVASRSFFGYY